MANTPNITAPLGGGNIQHYSVDVSMMANLLLLTLKVSRELI